MALLWIVLVVVLVALAAGAFVGVQRKRRAGGIIATRSRMTRAGRGRGSS
jgi:hypothetical protein